MPAVSVCVIACNEETVLPRCLDSVAWADEIVMVIDAKSHDRTETIAREHAQRVEVRPYEGDVQQKRYCCELASHDWVFVVDPDEVVTVDLARDVQQAIGRASDADAGFEVNRMTYHLNRWIRHGDFYPDWKLRLFRRSRSNWSGRNPHGRVEVNGRVQRLAGGIQHYSYVDLRDHVERIQSFSDTAAREMFKSGRRVRISDLVFRPAARFLRAYLLKAGFRDGQPGFIIAVATGFYVFLKYAKLWELERRQGRAAGPRSQRP
jgi:glycosyltransferase involved in cell wall biosynthesis